MAFSVSSYSAFLKKTAVYACYVTEAALPIAAICTKNSDFVAANIAFTALGTAFSCVGTFNRAYGWHNCAHLMGLGSSIASLAVGTSSAAFDIFCYITIGGFGGNLLNELFDRWQESGDEPAALEEMRVLEQEQPAPPAQFEYYRGPAYRVQPPIS